MNTDLRISTTDHFTTVEDVRQCFNEFGVIDFIEGHQYVFTIHYSSIKDQLATNIFFERVHHSPMQLIYNERRKGFEVFNIT